MYKIIIIDDIELTRKSIAKTIQRNLPDCTVVGEAADGQDGLQKILTIVPDIIISDIKMPNLDGLSMIQLVKTSFPNTQVIFITGYQDFENIHTALQLHASAFLLKPIHESQLIDAIRQAIGNIHKNSLSIFQELQNIKNLLLTENDSLLEQAFSRILEQADYQGHSDPSFLLSCIQQACSFMLHYYWNLSPKRISLEQETAWIYELHNVPPSRDEQIDFLLSYQNRLFLFSHREHERYSLMITHVLQYIHDNFRHELTLSDTALHFSINASYLSSRIKKETGQNFTDLVTTERLHYAKKLLRNPQKRINEVAEQSGFRDYTYLYQAFKKHEGISPKEYRNQFL